ncbi:MAG: nucleotide exchange factor GrpE [Alistipes sp.]|nr:nucleotide exchange factor GrpE [Alistipes sp.]
MDEKELNIAEESDIEEENTTAEAADASSEDEEDAVSEYNDVAAQISELEEKLEKATENLYRVNADYDNFRKRTAREKTETYANATAKCVEGLLPVIDSFERCLEAECSDENFKNGLNMIANQLGKFMADMNVTAIDALGKEFDPNFHNAMQQQSGTDYAANHVCAVYQKGYMLGDKLIRPALVAVAAD